MGLASSICQTEHVSSSLRSQNDVWGHALTIHKQSARRWMSCNSEAHSGAEAAALLVSQITRKSVGMSSGHSSSSCFSLFGPHHLQVLWSLVVIDVHQLVAQALNAIRNLRPSLALPASNPAMRLTC